MDTLPSEKIGSSGLSRRVMAPRTLAGFVVALGAVVVIAVLSYQSVQSSTDTARSLTRAAEVLGQLQSVISTLKDAETGQRGYLLTGREDYLEPFLDAKRSLPIELRTMQALFVNDPAQRNREATFEALAAEKMQELGETVDLRRSGKVDAALAIVLTDRGKNAMDRIRGVSDEMENAERNLIAERSAAWRKAATLSFTVTSGGAIVLVFLIGVAAVLAARDFRERRLESWLRTGQLGVGARTQGDQTLDRLGESVLQFLAQFLDAQVGAAFIEEDGRYRRVASYAIPQGVDIVALDPGDGLAGQAIKDKRVLRVLDVPTDYLPIGSATGGRSPRELLIAPAMVDGAVNAIVELGFFRAIDRSKVELLERVSEPIGIAVRTSKDRTRLEELLQQTQQQTEELQMREEELRVNNEELEEQGRSLRESRAQLESQQAELEQINSQLEEQTQALEHQRQALSRSHAELTEKTHELRRASEYKSEFLANMSHELRTPLNSTLILAKLLADNKEGNLTDNQIKYAQTISSAGKDLLNLINDILDISRIESGKIEVAPENVKLTELVSSLTKTVQIAAQEKRLGFQAIVATGTPDEIYTDPQRLGQILKNLLANALKFTERGEISLRIQSSAGEIIFAVQDTGVGIAAHQQEVIFEAFRQADGSIHRKYGGTGLGLSISRNLAMLLGGSISVTSSPGQGSTFTLALPIRYAAPASHEASAEGVQPRPVAAPPAVAARVETAAPALTAPGIPDDRESLVRGKRLILVVEDDLAFAAILRDLVREMGFQAVVTHSAADAMAATLGFQPSAILLDVNLPDDSGLHVLDRLKRNPRTRHIPVHMASVEDYRREALELGAVGYALKPVKREELVEALQRLEVKLSQNLRRVLIVEDDARQRDSIRQLLSNGEVEIAAVENAAAALRELSRVTFDCVVLDLNLPDLSGYDLLEKMARQEEVSFPPVIVYTGRALSRDEEQQLRRYSKSIIIKDARSPERLLDEVTLFLHQVESKLPEEQQRMLKAARNRDAALEGRRVLVVEDDVRNIFALSSVLEPNGATVQIARNGREALDALERSRQAPEARIDMVLMDIMMPEMDGFTAMREIRKRPEWKNLPIIALTAKAMRDDQEKCLAAGADDYIAKPLDVERLLSLVRVWMPK
jgi:CheY-like chemotaxis protein/CHASE3 domain sensor protein